MAGPFRFNGARVIKIDGADVLAPLAARAQVAASSAADDAGRAELAMDGATAAANLYPTTAAGLAATAPNGYFTVVGDGTSTYAILYRKVNGSAVEQARYASKGAYEGTGGAALIGFDGRSTDAKLRETVSVTDARFAGGAKLDGITNDSPAFAAAVASLTNGGVVRVPPGVKAILSEPITDAGKPIDFVFEGVGVRAPQDQAAFKLTANSSSITMQGSFSNTKVEMHPATQDPVMPTVNITVSAGVVTGVAMTSPGSRIRSPIVCRVRGSSTNQDAVIVFRINFATGQASEVTLLDGGGGYANAAAVQLNMEGGGVPLIWSAGPQANRLIGVRLNLGNKMYGVGVLLAGGWYQYWRDVGVDYESIGAKGYGVIIDSRDGPIGTGSYDAAYVNTFSNVRAGRMAAIGLDDKTPTTHKFDTLECTYLHLHLCRDFLFDNAVIQGAGDALVETVVCDNTLFIGGDAEGAPEYIHRSRGTCANTRFEGMRRDATGSAKNYIGEPGTGSVYHFSHSNGTDVPEYIGSGFTTGVAYRNRDWKVKHRIGTPYSGDTLVTSSNIKVVSVDAGILDDPTMPGFAHISVGGSNSLRIGMPGDFVSGTSGPVILREYTMLGPGGPAFPAAGVRVAGDKVLGVQGAAVDPSLPGDAKAEQLRLRMEAHGLIATWGA